MTAKIKPNPEVYVAIQTFHIADRGEPVVAGRTHVLEGDPLLRTYPHCFKPARESVVEQATAAPGELRGA